MMNMRVEEVQVDTAITYSRIKVIWGIRDDKICFLWKDYPKCFERIKNTSFNTTRVVRKKLQKILKLLEKEKEGRNENIKLRDIYRNPYGEIFLITILSDNGLIIFIVRLDGVYPTYVFTMIK